MLKERWARGLAIGAAAALLVFALDAANVFRRLEWKSWDARMSAFADPAKASEDIVLILVDQPSLDFYADLGITWPWPRELYGAIVRHLNAGGMKAVFFDITMTEGSRFGVEDDGTLAAAVAAAGNVYLPVFLGTEEAGPNGIPDRDALILFREKAEGVLPREMREGETPNRSKAGPEVFRSATLPIRELLQVSRGVVNVRVNPDADTIYRRMPLLFPFQSFSVGAVPLGLALAARPDLDVRAIPTDGDGNVCLRFFGPAGTYRAYSAAGIINSYAQSLQGGKPQVVSGDFAGKTVLLGLSAVGLHDIKASPLSGIISGVEIQAAALDTILNGHAFRFPGRTFTWVYIGLLALAAGFLLSHVKRTAVQIAAFAGVLFLPAALSAGAFAARTWLDFVAPETAVLLALIGAAVGNYAVEGRERRFLKGAFLHYLSPAVIDRILEEPGRLELGGEEREITSLFSDIAGFTTISEALDPAGLVALLNAYLTEMTDLILDSGGTLDKYEGDAIIAFWNAPLDTPDHALRAARAALACRARLDEIGPELDQRFGRRISARIGLNTGPAIVGNMGSARRFDYTAIGDTVNLAARLESAGKQYGLYLLAGEATVEKAGEALVSREIDLVRVIGKTKPVRIYELVGEAGRVSVDALDRLERFSRGLELFRGRSFADAAVVFAGLRNDPAAALYVERCRRLEAAPPPGDWDFVYGLQSK